MNCVSFLILFLKGLCFFSFWFVTISSASGAETENNSDVAVMWANSLTRMDLLRLSCERTNGSQVLKQQQALIEGLRKGNIVNQVVRVAISYIIYSNGKINYREAAIVLGELHRARWQYDKSFVTGHEALTAFVALFPLAVSDEEIKKIATSVNWIVSEEQWAVAFWVGDVSRNIGRKDHMAIQWLGPLFPRKMP